MPNKDLRKQAVGFRLILSKVVFIHLPKVKTSAYAAELQATGH